MDTARGTNDHVNAVLKYLHVVADDGTSNAGVAFHVHEIADCHDNLLDLLGKLTGGGQNQGLALLDAKVDLLKDRD